MYTKIYNFAFKKKILRPNKIQILLNIDIEREEKEIKIEHLHKEKLEENLLLRKKQLHKKESL